MNRLMIAAATLCFTLTPVSAGEFSLTDTHLAITFPDDCKIDSTAGTMDCKDQDGLYLTNHFHVEPGKSAKEQNFLTQFKLGDIANSGNDKPFKKGFEKDRARAEMKSELAGGGICVVDPNPYIDLAQVGNNVWAFIGIWGETTCNNVALIFEKLEIWDAGRRVIMDFTVANHDPHIGTMNDIVKSLRFNP